MAFFKNNQPKDAGYYKGRISSASISMLLFAVLTVVNVVSSVTGGDTYFLFSAAVPYFLVALGMEWCGMLPPEYYLEYYEGIPEFLDPSFFTVLLVAAIVIVLIYLLVTVFIAKGKKWALICALVIAALDTLAALVLQFGTVDLLFHGWLIFDLATALHAHRKLSAATETAAQDGEGECVLDGVDTESRDGATEDVPDIDRGFDDSFAYFTDTDNRDGNNAE